MSSPDLGAADAGHPGTPPTPIRRRNFIAFVGGATVGSAFPAVRRLVATRYPPIRAIAFDGFAVFDPTPVAQVARTIFPRQADELVAIWRSRQFEYQWLRTLGGRYADFATTAADSLTFAARSLGLALPRRQHARLLETWLTLVPWPGAPDAIHAFRSTGLRLAFLSNMSEQMLRDGARRGGFSDAFDHWLTTDHVRSAKPHRRAYKMAPEAFRLQPGEIVFVAFASWDAAGAAWFGLRTVWTNRLAQPAEELGILPALVVRDLADVVEFVQAK